MKRNLKRKGFWLMAMAVPILAAAFLLAQSFAEVKPPPKLPNLPPDVAKIVLAPQANAAKAPRNGGIGKGLIESPTEEILAANTTPAASTPGDGAVNPRVQPGKVRWHSDFAAARRAALNSGKPVLLFQMMGRLDERFC